MKEELLEFFAEAADPMSVKDVCMPDCKVIYEGGPVLYGQIGKFYSLHVSMVVLQVVKELVLLIDTRLTVAKKI